MDLQAIKCEGTELLLNKGVRMTDVGRISYSISVSVSVGSWSPVWTRARIKATPYDSCRNGRQSIVFVTLDDGICEFQVRRSEGKSVEKASEIAGNFCNARWHSTDRGISEIESSRQSQ
jgi:hypothetical protein